MTIQLVPQVCAAAWEGDCVDTGVATIRGLECLFGNLIGPVPSLIALVAVIMIILAGVRLITAGSEPKAVAAAWSTFTWAIIGIILLSVAWLVIVFIGKFTGANITTFTIPSPTPIP